MALNNPIAGQILLALNMTIKFDTHFKEILAGALWSLLLRILGAVLGFGFNILLARTLGSNSVGIYYLSLSICTISSVAARLGLDNAALRFIAVGADIDDWKSINGIYWRSFAAVLAASTFFSMIIVALAPFLAKIVFNKPLLEHPLQIMALSIISLSLLAFHAEVFKARKKIIFATMIQGVGVPLLGLVALFFLAEKIEQTSQVAKIYLSATTLVMILGFISWHLTGSKFREIGRRYSLATLLQTSLPMMATALLSLVTNWASTLALGLWASSEEIGYFGAAYRCAMLTSFALVAVNSIAAPKFAAMFSQNQSRELGTLAKQCSKLTFLASAPVLLFYVFFTDRVLSLFGQGFEQAKFVLIILSIGQLFVALTGSVGFLLMMTGLERQMQQITMWSAFTAICLNAILVPPYGMEGAAIATALSMAGRNLSFIYLVKRHHSILALPFVQK